MLIPNLKLDLSCQDFELYIFAPRYTFSHHLRMTVCYNVRVSNAAGLVFAGSMLVGKPG